MVVGHFSRDCPSREPDVCRNCGEEGHRARDCEKEKVMTCRNCDGQGHISRECPEPRNMSRVQCRNCDECALFHSIGKKRLLIKFVQMATQGVTAQSLRIGPG